MTQHFTQTLTKAKIIADCKSKLSNYTIIIGLIFITAIMGHIFIQTLFSVGLTIFISGAILSIGLFLFTYRKRKQIADSINSDDFRLIRGLLMHTHEFVGADDSASDSTLVSFYCAEEDREFFYHSKYDSIDLNNINLKGKWFYLVLMRDKKNDYQPVTIYPEKDTKLSKELISKLE